MARALRCEDSDGSQRHTPVIDTILPMTLLYLLSSSESLIFPSPGLNLVRRDRLLRQRQLL